MAYQRTEEIKHKNSEAAKRSWAKRTEEDKRRQYEIRSRTFEEKRLRGERVGRPVRDPPITKICPNCKNSFECRTVNSKKRIFCTSTCYHIGRRGKPLHPNLLEAVKTMDRSYMKTEEYRVATSDPSTSAYKRYRNKVQKLSESTYVKFQHIINPQGHPRTLAGVEGGWQLDHIKSVRSCFDEGWTPEQASELSNLQMLPWEENRAKWQ